MFQVKMKKNKSASNDGDKSSAKELNPPPNYIEERLAIWDKLKTKYLSNLAEKTKNSIKVKLPDGKEVEAIAWETTAYDIAKGIRYNFLNISYIYIKLEKELLCCFV